MLGTGEEVEMDLAQMEADSPILWIRLFCHKYSKKMNLTMKDWPWNAAISSDHHNQPTFLSMGIYVTLWARCTRTTAGNRISSSFSTASSANNFGRCSAQRKVLLQVIHLLLYNLTFLLFVWRIRRDAAFCLVHIYNSLPDSQLGESPPLIDYFCQQIGCKTCPYIPQPNNYVATSSNLQNYFLFQVYTLKIQKKNSMEWI